nr:hypothetical protein [Tanacetum cinerariifolium]
QGRWFCVGVSSGGRGGDVGRVEKEQGRGESAVAGDPLSIGEQGHTRNRCLKKVKQEEVREAHG